MLPRFIPFVDIALSRQDHDRWFAAYDYHSRQLTDTQCDKPCKMRQRAQMHRALIRTVVSGILHTQTLVLRSDCTEAMLHKAKEEYVQAFGVSVEKLPEIERQLNAVSLGQTLDGAIASHRTLYSVN